LCTILPATTPDSVNPSPAAEIVQVIALGTDPLVAWLVNVCPPAEKVRSSVVGTKIPLPPDEKVRWATFQVVGAAALPLLTTNVPLTPLPQSKVPDNAVGAFDGAAPTADVPSPGAKPDGAQQHR
jgi:hypothetical protein